MALLLLAGPAAAQSVSPLAAAEPLSKKQRWLELKARGDGVSAKPARVRAPPAPPPVTFVHTWTWDVLPYFAETPPTPEEAARFLRCHFTGRHAWIDPALLAVAHRAALHFGARRVEVVSGYRDPKYNRILRKKGREVGRRSFHTLGRALDFRLPGVTAKTLAQFLRGIAPGGVGIYRHSGFVHVDDGPVRNWGGT